MLNVHELKAQDLHGLSPSSLAEVAAQMLRHIGQQSSRIDWQSNQIAERDRAIKFKDAKLERITFELARLKAWKFAAKTERMNAEQRQLFEETLAADEASLEAQLEALQAQAGVPTETVPVEARRRPKRQALPEHLPRVEHTHEPEDTSCPTPDCGQPMVRVGEDVSERLDIGKRSANPIFSADAEPANLVSTAMTKGTKWIWIGNGWSGAWSRWWPTGRRA